MSISDPTNPELNSETNSNSVEDQTTTTVVETTADAVSTTEDSITETEITSIKDEAPKVESTTDDISAEEPINEDSTPKKEEILAVDSDGEVTTSKNEAVAKPKEIPVEDYGTFSQEELLESLKKLLNNYPVQAIKNQVEDIRSHFNKNFDEKAAAKKEEFLAEGGNIIDFYFTTPLKREFNDLYFSYKDKKNEYFKTLKSNQESNLKTRLQIIEDLKALIAASESVNHKFNTFNDLKEQWHQAGSIPRDQNNVVWNTYYHHVDKFYEVIHLNREFRDLDYKHNLEQKLKIIERAIELTHETSINTAFRELQVLHKIWKEEIGPVAKEYKDLIWDKFSEVTKQIHDHRQEYFAEQDEKQKENLVARQQIIEQINALTEVPRSSHNEWQKSMEQLNELEEAFKKAGRVPSEFKNSIWNDFRAAERSFNHAKNEFYKEAKSEQLDNLTKKRKLIEIAESHKDSEDIETTTGVMKRIQSEWKTIGHVPRKDSDKVWKQFKQACNHFFDRLHKEKEEANKELDTAYEQKVAFLETLKTLEVTDIESITSKIEEWKAIGNVPYNKRNIEQDFNKQLDGLFSKLNINPNEVELIKFETKLANLANQDDTRLIQNEKVFIRKKMDELKSNILQLENNLLFFKHAKPDNPMVMDVNSKITKHQEDLTIWKNKWTKIKSL